MNRKKEDAAKPVKEQKGNHDAVLAAFKTAGKGGFKFQITKNYERELASAAGYKRPH